MALDKPLNLTFSSELQNHHLETDSSKQTSEEDIALKTALDVANKNLSKKNQQIKKLVDENNRLKKENEETQHRQELLSAELYKAEEQFESLKNILKEAGLI